MLGIKQRKAQCKDDYYKYCYVSFHNVLPKVLLSSVSDIIFFILFYYQQPSLPLFNRNQIIRIENRIILKVLYRVCFQFRSLRIKF